LDGDVLVACRAMVDLRIGLLANSRHHHGKALRPRRIQKKKWKASVAGNETEFHCAIPSEGGSAPS